MWAETILNLLFLAADAVFISSLSIGGNGSDSLLVDSYSKTYNEGTMVGGGSITVRHKDCFPLGSQFMGTSSETGPPGESDNNSYNMSNHDES